MATSSWWSRRRQACDGRLLQPTHTRRPLDNPHPTPCGACPWDTEGSHRLVDLAGDAVRVDALLLQEAVQLGLDPLVALLGLGRPPQEQQCQADGLPHQLEEL